MWSLLALFLTGAHAGSMDYLQVTAPFGSPGAEDGTAAHWNPAGLATGVGTRFHIEGAPTFATVDFERNDPYNRGLDQYRLKAVVPFLGIASDLNVDGLGVGLSLAVPFARGVDEGPDGAGPAKYNLRSGQIQTIFLTGAVGYRVFEGVNIGAGLVYVRSSWAAHLHTEALTSLADALEAQGESPGYDDGMLEDPDYGAELIVPGLSDDRVTFNVGVQIAPAGKWKISAAYTHGVKVVNKGSAQIRMGCPPQEDVSGRFGSESYGLCDGVFEANASVAYTLPGRINGSVVYRANPNLRLEAMGGWVNWGVYKEFTLRISDVGTLNTLQHEDTAGLLNKKRVQARDAHNTFWTALDVKAQPFEAFGFGGRITFDQSAIPTASLSPNNFDANTLILGGFVSAKPNKRYTLVLGFSQYLAASRVVSDSLFGVTLDRANRNEERYFYPQANGTYSSSISRLSLALRGTIGPLR